MRIEDHPFSILGITPRSSGREIWERAEALIRQGDPERINACRFKVMHPVHRLDLEVSWFPGVSPSVINDISGIVRQGTNVPIKFSGRLRGVECLVRHYSLQSEVASFVVQRETDNGSSQPSGFISRFVDRYQIQIRPTQERYAKDVALDCERILSMSQEISARSSESGGASDVEKQVQKKIVGAALDELEGELRKWGAVARPAQLVMKSRGLTDVRSVELVRSVRSATERLSNKFGMHKEAKRITKALEREANCSTKHHAPLWIVAVCNGPPKFGQTFSFS